MNQINVTRSSMPSFEEYCEEIRDLWETRWLTNMGAKHNELEERLKEYLGSEHVILTVNGHMALELALQALDLHGEVITTPFTFVSTTLAITRSGLTPVFCDIEPENFTIDADKLESLVTSRTRAIMPVHVYGHMCNTEAIQHVADKHGLRVIYDAAHAFGETYQGRGAGAFGDVSCFSFHATKVFHTVEGGAVCCRDPALAERLRLLRNYGFDKTGDVASYGANMKMSEFHAAMGLCNLRHLDDEIAKRKAAASRYRELLKDVEGIYLCAEQLDVKYNYAYFPAVFDGCKYTRDEVFERLKARGITPRKYFYPLTSSLACYRELPTAGAKNTPVAAHIAEQILCLPMYAGLETCDVDRVCETILNK